MPEVPGVPLAAPIFGRSVNPIPTGEGRLCPPITTGTPQKISPSGIPEYLNDGRLRNGYVLGFRIGSSWSLFLQEKTLECADPYVFEVFWKILG